MSSSSALDIIRANRFIPTADYEEAKRNYDYDLDRFLKYSSTGGIRPDPVVVESFLTSAYHALEKGLAMAEPYAGFGQRYIPIVLAGIAELEHCGHARFATQGARGCLAAYVRYHDSRGFPLPAQFEMDLRVFAAEANNKPALGGSITLTRRAIEEATNFDYAQFVGTRYSVRHFTGERVSPDAVRQAVGLAMKTPRTCNREMRRVYVVYEPILRHRVLNLHYGNRGFGDCLGALLIVTADIRELYEIAERNQAWIDGGLFAMSLVYALHSARLGTCMLNWSVDYKHDQKFRTEFNIPDNEVIVTFIGVGHVPDTFEVAASPAPSVHEVLSELKAR
ncbi:nitroreductase family protein [Bradyrhizobium sp. IC3069]|uniref:nitroreductase family protein n=1 Tax=unclassified Bradyrhizobium TaxID=2631580 RepID=UPI001CD61254|nr:MULTISPECIES: nitroreductase family protein [unclassified Bradyrhizobium]MCA1363370.1 nitroreductase family protein [Bradyrhizobium sp. IC4059]MCA1520908.1 nitroreductase family protein [Bradyrhizobium sp. IC3069]